MGKIGIVGIGLVIGMGIGLVLAWYGQALKLPFVLTFGIFGPLASACIIMFLYVKSLLKENKDITEM